MMFESFIQIVVQIMIINYFNSLEEEQENSRLLSDDDDHVEIEGIKESVALAVIHIFLELFQLYFEAKACKTSMIDYSVACFNGKFGWVPYINIIS